MVKKVFCEQIIYEACKINGDKLNPTLFLITKMNKIVAVRLIYTFVAQKYLSSHKISCLISEFF